MNIAIIGKAPSSRLLAPYDDDSWSIWSLSDNHTVLPRWDEWFELHDLDRYKESYGEYYDWLCSLPADGKRDNSTVAVDFNLPETAADQTVKLTFTRTSGSADSDTHILRVVSEASGDHTFTLDGTDMAGGTAEIEAVESGDGSLNDGTIYDVKIEYQDIYANDAASATNTGFTYDITTQAPTLTAPASPSSDNSDIAVDFNLPEIGILQ